MKKILLWILLVFSLSSFWNFSYADPCTDRDWEAIPCSSWGWFVPPEEELVDPDIPTTSFKVTVMTVVNYFLWFLWLLWVIMIVWAWILMVTSAWEEEQFNKWKDIIKYVIIWFVIIFLSYSIIRLLTGIEDAQSWKGSTIVDINWKDWVAWIGWARWDYLGDVFNADNWTGSTNWASGDQVLKPIESSIPKLDSDKDWIPDEEDPAPNNSKVPWIDPDGDWIANDQDSDDDNDWV